MKNISTGFSDDIPYKGTNYFLRYIAHRLESNKNFLAAVIGPTGSGKSFSALSMMELKEGDKLCRNNICFKAREFVARLNSEDLRNKSFLVWDETGVDLNAKQWASLMNKVINLILQTFRHRNLIVFFTVPHLSFLDSDTRKLLHAVIKTKKIDFKTKTTIVQPLLIQINDESGKMYRKYLRVTDNRGRTIAVKRIRLPMPSQDLIDWYECKKLEFTTNLNLEVSDILRKLDEKKKFKAPELTEKQKMAYELYQELGTEAKVAEVMGIRQTGVSSMLKAVKKKLNLEKLPKKIKE